MSTDPATETTATAATPPSEPTKLVRRRDHLLDSVARAACDLLRTPTALLSRRRDGRDVIVAAAGAHADDARGARLPDLGLPLEPADAASPGLARIADVRAEMAADVADALARAGLASLLAVPLLGANGRRLGALAVGDAEPRSWDDEAVRTLATVATVAESALRRVAVEGARSRTERALRRSDERLRLVELATQDVLWDWDLATGHLSWNGAIARRFRYMPEEVRPSIDWHEERLHPEDRERVLRGLERAILGVDTFWSDEYRFLRGDGSYATVLDRAYVVRNGRSEPVRIIGWMLDITQRKAMEDVQRFLAGASGTLGATLELEATSAAFARLCTASFADFCLLDLIQVDGTLRRVAVAHADRAREPALAAGAALTDAGEADVAPLAVARTGVPRFVPDCAAAGMDPAETCRRLCLGEDAAPRAYMVVPVKARSRLLGAATFGITTPRRRFGPLDLVTAKDLGRRAGLAIDNAFLYETARRAVQARNDVLDVVSHDLRVPVNTMIATLSLLADTVPERREEVRRWLDVLHRATEQMKALTDDLLDATRMDSQHFSVDRAPESVAVVVNEACEMMRPLAAAKEIVLDCAGQDTPARASVDRLQIQRALGNLLGNAIKFSHRGAHIRVNAAARDSELSVSVADDGPGIPASDLPRVFDRFWKGRTNDRRGAGLGLAIAKGIVEAHGGRIWVDSVEGAGSTFSFAVPLEQPPSEPPADGAAEPAPPSTGDAPGS